MPEASLAICKLAWPVTALGPGARAVVWTAGCARRCPGCISPGFLDPGSGVRLPAATIAERILSLPASLRGVTLTGGDPVDQHEGVVGLLRQLRKFRPEWDVILYTGWLREEMESDLAGKGLLLGGLVDLLIDGPFLQGTPQAHPLAGSGNQRLHPLTAAGEKLLVDSATNRAPAFNIGISTSADDLLIGIGTFGARARTHEKLGLSRSHKLCAT